MKKKKLNRALSVIANVFVYAFCALCMLLLLFTVFSKRDADGAVKVFGYEMRIVLSSSMEKHPDVDVSEYKIKDIKTGSMVFIQLVPDDEMEANDWYTNLQVGDVLTFRYMVALRQETVTHRIVDIQTNDTGGFKITLRGDNLSDNGTTGVQVINTDNIESPNYVIGKVTGKNFVLGWLVYSLKRPQGLATLIIIPCLIIIIWNVVKIVSVFSSDKRKRTQEIVVQQLSEMEELKRRICELESANQDDGTTN